MDKQRIIDYVMNSPYNSNPAVLGSLLDQYASNVPAEEVVIVREQEITTAIDPSTFTDLPEAVLPLEEAGESILPHYWTVEVNGEELVPLRDWQNSGQSTSDQFLMWIGSTCYVTFHPERVNLYTEEPTTCVVKIIAVPRFSEGSYNITENDTYVIPTKNFVNVEVPLPSQDIITVNLVLQPGSSLLQETSFSISYSGIDNAGVIQTQTINATIYPDISSTQTLNIVNGTGIFISDGAYIYAISTGSSASATIAEIHELNSETIEGIYIKQKVHGSAIILSAAINPNDGK